MSNWHTLIIKDENEKVIYENQIFGITSHADEVFYKNLGLELGDDGALSETEVDFENLVYEWWSYISRTLVRERYFEHLEKDLNEKDKDDIFLNSVLFSWSLLGNFYITVYEITRGYTEEFNYGKLKNGYKLYLKTKDKNEHKTHINN